MDAITRREFIQYSGAAAGALMLGIKEADAMDREKSQVGFVHTEDRKTGVVASIEALGINPVKNKSVLIKPNFNTADAVPGSTDNKTLEALIEKIWEMGAKSVRLGERSYPLTWEVMAAKNIVPLLEKLDVEIVNFDDLPDSDWVKVEGEGSHWRDGFRIARPILETECLVSTCCLKTHQFGGVFTMSLKLHVGVVPTTRHGYDYMRELHSSPHQRKMIAEINAHFHPDLIVLDGIDAFVDGGPMTGKRARGNLFLASTDRIAVDAVGLAALKHLGSNPKIMETKIFDQEQIARAVDLGLGAPSADAIDLVSADRQSTAYRNQIAEILKKA